MIENTDTLSTLAIAGGSGGVSALVTIAALRVHIDYLRKGLEVVQKRISRVQDRLRWLEVRIGSSAPAERVED